MTQWLRVEQTSMAATLTHWTLPDSAFFPSTVAVYVVYRRSTEEHHGQVEQPS